MEFQRLMHAGLAVEGLLSEGFVQLRLRDMRTPSHPVSESRGFDTVCLKIGRCDS